MLFTSLNAYQEHDVKGTNLLFTGDLFFLVTVVADGVGSTFAGLKKKKKKPVSLCY